MQQWSGAGGKRVLITGATNGIGLAGARALAKLGADLTIVARDEQRAAAAVKAIREVAGPGPGVDVLMADLASQASVRQLAEQALARYPRIDVLVNNAGAINTSRRLSADGRELTWAVNHLAPFLLTNLLLERLRESAPARIVTTSSDAHHGSRIAFDDLDATRSYAARGWRAYGQSKLANILFTSELARRLQGSEVTANCFHPGVVATGFNRNNGLLARGIMTVVRPFFRSPETAAKTLAWLVDSPDLDGVSGGYFADCKLGSLSEAAQDVDAARRLWEVSAEQTGLTAVSPGRDPLSGSPSGET